MPTDTYTQQSMEDGVRAWYAAAAAFNRGDASAAVDAIIGPPDGQRFYGWAVANCVLGAGVVSYETVRRLGGTFNTDELVVEVDPGREADAVTRLAVDLVAAVTRGEGGRPNADRVLTWASPDIDGLDRLAALLMRLVAMLATVTKPPDSIEKDQ